MFGKEVKGGGRKIWEENWGGKIFFLVWFGERKVGEKG